MGTRYGRMKLSQPEPQTRNQTVTAGSCRQHVQPPLRPEQQAELTK